MFTLSDEERQILTTGQNFAKLNSNPAYQWLMETVEYMVEEAQRDHEDALLNGSPDTCLKFGIRFVERRLFRDLVKSNIGRRIEAAKLLAEQIQKQEEGNNEHDASGDPEREHAYT